MAPKEWETHNPSGSKRVVVTKELPGSRWLETLIKAGCRVELCTATDVLSVEEIKAAIGAQCDGVLGQLTEDWGDELFAALKAAGGTAYSNVAVGYNNVDVDAATLRAGKYKGWLMTLFLGELLWRKTVGVIGAGRIGATYARMMVEGHKMDLIYYDIYPNMDLEEYISAYGDFLESRGEEPVSCKRADTVADVLREADCISVHTVLDESTHHLINADSLALMKENAILVNTSRGPVVDEAALVAHCQKHPDFRAALDVFEDEPEMKPGLVELDNVLIVPHIASATRWTREGMASLAAGNVAGILSGYPAWNQPDILSFLEGESPQAAPSIVNAKELGIPLFTS